jgi:hypothetical protein
MLKTRTDSLTHCHYVIFDEEWQYPAATEKQASIKAAELCAYAEDSLYLGFPWATLIDRLNCKDDRAKHLLKELAPCKSISQKYKRVATVCQHIYMFKYLYLFVECGVTDIFWSHATATSNDEANLAGYSAITIHPFPLFPVAYCQGEFAKPRNKKYLFSFVGAKSSLGYLSNTRDLILECHSNTPNTLVKSRNGWHYGTQVYEEQVRGISDVVNRSSLEYSQEDKTKEFIDLLSDSAFSLCPSGTGPNSIRLWEAIQSASIPVILADGLQLPGNLKLWDAASIRIPETRQSIEKLPRILEDIVNDQERYLGMVQACKQLAMVYGPDYFIHDIALYFLDRVASQPAEAPNSSAKLDSSKKQHQRRLRTIELLLTELEECASNASFDSKRLCIMIRNRDIFLRSRLASLTSNDAALDEILNRIATVKANAGWYTPPKLSK